MLPAINNHKLHGLASRRTIAGGNGIDNCRVGFGDIAETIAGRRRALY